MFRVLSVWVTRAAVSKVWIVQRLDDPDLGDSGSPSDPTASRSREPGDPMPLVSELGYLPLCPVEPCARLLRWHTVLFLQCLCLFTCSVLRLDHGRCSAGNREDSVVVRSARRRRFVVPPVGGVHAITCSTLMPSALASSAR